HAPRVADRGAQPNPRNPAPRPKRTKVPVVMLKTPNASKFDNRVHETATASGVGETSATDGIHLAGLPDGHRLAEGSLPAHPQGWRSWCGRHNRGGLRARPGGEPPAPARPREVRLLPGAPGAAGAHPLGRLNYRDPSDRDPHPGGQGPPTGG